MRLPPSLLSANLTVPQVVQELIDKARERGADRLYAMLADPGVIETIAADPIQVLRSIITVNRDEDGEITWMTRIN